MVLIVASFNNTRLILTMLHDAIIIHALIIKTYIVLVDIPWIDTCITEKKLGKHKYGKIGRRQHISGLLLVNMRLANGMHLGRS